MQRFHEAATAARGWWETAVRRLPPVGGAEGAGPGTVAVGVEVNPCAAAGQCGEQAQGGRGQALGVEHDDIGPGFAQAFEAHGVAKQDGAGVHQYIVRTAERSLGDRFIADDQPGQGLPALTHAGGAGVRENLLRAHEVGAEGVDGVGDGLDERLSEASIEARPSQGLEGAPVVVLGEGPDVD